MFVVDTNVLLYAADLDSPDHIPCRTLIEEWRRGSTPWYITWGVVYEFLRVATHPNVFRNPFPIADAWKFLNVLMLSTSLSVLGESERHAQIVSEVLQEIPDIRGNLVFDTHTAILMRENGIRKICTRDTDFHRFPFAEIIDPLREYQRLQNTA